LSLPRPQVSAFSLSFRRWRGGMGGHFHWNDARVGQPCLCRERNAITRRFLAMHGMSDKCGDEASGENKQGNLKHE
jgi:hypothetical protein